MTTTLNGIRFNAIGRVKFVEVEPQSSENFLSAYRDGVVDKQRMLTTYKAAKQYGLRIIKFIF